MEKKMTTQNYYEDIQHVVYISTNISKSCEHCTERLGLDHFAESVNHYIKQHEYKLLHVGTETGEDMNGNPRHHTIAVLGK